MLRYSHPGDVIEAICKDPNSDVGFSLPNIMRTFDLILDTRFPFRSDRYLKEERGFFTLSDIKILYLPCTIYIGTSEVTVWSRL